MQFRMRWKAADTIEGLRRAINILSTNPDSVPDAGIEMGKKWPRFVESEIRITMGIAPRDCYAALGQVMPWGLQDLDDRWKTEIPSKTAVITATIVAIVVLL